MELKGRLKDVTMDMDGNYHIAFTTKEMPMFSKLQDKDLRIKAVQWREKRSLDANAYMWILLQKMAEALKTSKDELYIEILSRYGVFTHIVVNQRVVDRVKAEWRLVKELGEVKFNNQVGIQLQCYFGSSTYNTAEMARLIDGLVSECKELDIETLTPRELQSMKEAWGK